MAQFTTMSTYSLDEDIKLMKEEGTGEIRIVDSSGWYKGRSIKGLPHSQLLGLFPDMEHLFDREEYHE